MVEVGIRLAFWAALEGSSGLGSAKPPWTHVACPHVKPAGRLVNAVGCRRHLGIVHAQKRGSAAGARLLLLWPWGGRFKANKSMSIGSGCGRGYRWLRLTLQGRTWDLSRFLKHYFCLSNKN